MAKKNRKYSPIILIISVVIGLLCAAVIINYMEQLENIWLAYFILMLTFIIGIIVSTVIHEAGHLLFGLMTGYRFSSFRIFSFMWIKQDGKLHLKRLSIPGTAGQCLMIPPAFDDGKYPVILYNLGGVFANLYTALCFYLIALLCRGFPFLYAFFQIFALAGLLLALTNGIPSSGSALSNDGKNTLMVHKSKRAKYTFWLQLKISQQLSAGVRLKDMPDAWFFVPSDDEMKNPLLASMSSLVCSRLMDSHKFQEADALIAHILQSDCAIPDIHRKLLTCERIYVELITENRWNTVQSMLTKEQKDFMKAMKNSATVMHTQYAYALLAERDRITADRIRARFEKLVKKAPYTGEIQTEQELMEIVREQFI